MKDSPFNAGIHLGMLLLFLLSACGRNEPVSSLPEEPLSRPLGPYLGEERPGEAPKIFSPGFVSTEFNEREPSLTPDGESFYYWVILPGYTVILVSHLEAEGWTEPEVASFSGKYSDFEPSLSIDGKKLFFCSDRPLPGKSEQDDTNIWVMDKEASDWGEPYPLNERVNSDRVEFFPSLTEDGTLYFSRLNADSSGTTVYRSAFVDGAYAEPEPLPDAINAGNLGSNVFVAADESYLLMPRPGPGGQVELHVSFREEGSGWTDLIPLGSELYSMSLEDGARVSPDGRFIFFSATRYPTAGGIWGKPMKLDQAEGQSMAVLRDFHRGPQNGGQDVYWVRSTVIDNLRFKSH